MTKGECVSCWTIISNCISCTLMNTGINDVTCLLCVDPYIPYSSVSGGRAICQAQVCANGTYALLASGGLSYSCPSCIN